MKLCKIFYVNTTVIICTKQEQINIFYTDTYDTYITYVHSMQIYQAIQGSVNGLNDDESDN